MGASCAKGPGTTFSLLVSSLACLVREDEKYLKKILVTNKSLFLIGILQKYRKMGITK